MKVFFKRMGVNEEPVCLVMSLTQRLPTEEIAQIFGVVPSTLTVQGAVDRSCTSLTFEEIMGGVDTSQTLGEIMRLRPGVGNKVEPFQVWGYLGPLEPGFRADFSGFTGRFGLQVVRQLHMSPANAVYSVIMVEQNGVSDEDPLVLKQLLRSESVSEELDTYQQLEELRKTRACPSLPQLVGHGFFLASGKPHPHFGDVESRLIKPLGSCVSGKLFTSQQVLKAAFDLLLALYHLYLIERRHRNVKAENIIHVQQQDQFLLIDFRHASAECNQDPGEVPDAVSLVLTLAQMAGWNGAAGNHAAAIELGRVSPVLASFAYYAFALPSSTARLDYRHWLPQLASAAGLPPPELSLV